MPNLDYWLDSVTSSTDAPVNFHSRVTPIEGDIFQNVINIPVSAPLSSLDSFVEALRPGKTVMGLPSEYVALGLFGVLVWVTGRKRRR